LCGIFAQLNKLISTQSPDKNMLDVSDKWRRSLKRYQTCLEVLSVLLLFEQIYKSNKVTGSFSSCFHQLHI